MPAEYFWFDSRNALMHYYALCAIWDVIIVAGIDEYSIITVLVFADTVIVTAKHGNDWNMKWIDLIQLK